MLRLVILQLVFLVSQLEFFDKRRRVEHLKGSRLLFLRAAREDSTVLFLWVASEDSITQFAEALLNSCRRVMTVFILNHRRELAQFAVETLHLFFYRVVSHIDNLKEGLLTLLPLLISCFLNHETKNFSDFRATKVRTLLRFFETFKSILKILL